MRTLTLTLTTAALTAALLGGVALLAAAPPLTTTPRPSPATATDLAATRDAGVQAVAAARTQLGVPYVWGGTTPGRALDCSGLTQWAWQQAGVALPRTTTEQLRVGTAVPVTELQPGDLVFTRGGRPTRDYGHVGLYTGENTVIVAPHTGANVRIQALQPHRVQAARRPTTTLTHRDPTTRG